MTETLIFCLYFANIQNVFNKKGEKVAENTYDDFGQVCFQVAEADADQEWEYAFTGVLNVEINPNDEFLSYTFDEKGRQVAMVNGAGEQIRMEYDGQNQLIRQTDPRGNSTRFEYDNRNNLRFTYDARNGASGTTYKIEQQRVGGGGGGGFPIIAKAVLTFSNLHWIY